MNDSKPGQNKIQIIDGQQVEVLTGDNEADEEEPEDYEDFDELLEPPDTEGGALVGTGVEQKMMAVDGQQYVVLELMQLPENSAAGGTTVKAEADQQAKSLLKTFKEGQSGPPTAKKAIMDSEKKQADLASAFGFDDDDEDE